MLKKYYWQLLTHARWFWKRQLPAWLRYSAVLMAGGHRAGKSGVQHEKHMLLLAWEFPPQVTGGVYRPTSFARYAHEAGWKTTVITGPLSETISDAGRYLAQTVPDTVAIHRVPPDKGVTPWPLPDLDGGFMNALAVYERAADFMENESPGVIVASGPPFHNFVAGMWLARRFGWKLVLDYRDEWIECPFDFVLKDSSNRRLERQCLHHADQVTFTTPSQLNHEVDVFDELQAEKCSVIYNGWEPDDFQAVAGRDETQANVGSGKITLAYLGNLGPMASPDNFLDSLAEVLEKSPELRKSLTLKLIGYKRKSAIDALNRFPYPEVLELIDHVPKTDACNIMQSVDVLLLLNPPTVARYIQGKTYEYVASRTPVLVFGEGGEMADIINRLGNGIVVAAGNAHELGEALMNLSANFVFDEAEIESWLQSRYRKRLAHEMFGLLESVRTSG